MKTEVITGPLDVTSGGGDPSAITTLDLSGYKMPEFKKDHLGLSELDGFNLRYSTKPIPPHKLKVIDGQEYATASELVGQSGGRIAEWKLKYNIESARARNWPGIKPAEFRDGHIAICGSGPSIGTFPQLRELRALTKKGVKVHAINRCHDFLITKGIYPWSASLLDPIPHVASYITPRRGIRYEIGSQCDPKTFDVFDKSDIQHFIWHARTSPNVDSRVFNAEELMIAVPSRTSTNGLRSIMLKYLEGFRHFHLFGFDSSYETYKDDEGETQIKLGADGKGKLHAHAKPEALHDVRYAKVLDQSADGNIFYEADYYTNSPMLAQADEFKLLLSDIAEGIRGGFMDQVFVYVHGDGLIPDIACSPKYPLHIDRKRIRHA